MNFTIILAAAAGIVALIEGIALCVGAAEKRALENHNRELYIARKWGKK